MNKPDLSQAWIVPMFVQVPKKIREFRYVLPATGYLVGLAVNPHMCYGEFLCHLENWDVREQEDTRFLVPMAMSSGGMIFPKLLPNANATLPWILVMESLRKDSPDIPPVTIYPIGCWGEM